MIARERLKRWGFYVAALSLAFNILLSAAHMGFLGTQLNLGGDGLALSGGNAAPTTEQALVGALLQICTEHGLTQRDAIGKGAALFVACPLCALLAAATTFILAAGLLLAVLRRRRIGVLRPLVAARVPGEICLRLAQPRGPPPSFMSA